MPSRLITSTANALSGEARVRTQAKSALAQVTQGVQSLGIAGPFLGLQPDVDPNLTDGSVFNELTNVLARAHGQDHGEVLGLPDGYRQVDFPRLPLGYQGAYPGSAAATATADAVVRIDQITRVSPYIGGTDPGDFSGEFRVTPMVVTAGDGINAGSGTMYRINAAGQWTQVAAAASMAAGPPLRQLKATRDGRTPTSPSMPDSCVAPFGATARATVGGAGADGQSGILNEPAWIFTNDIEEVMVFPSSTPAPTGTLSGIHTYEPLTSHAQLDGGGAAGFKAKSVETWNGRVYFLNTSEVGIRRSRRLRRTAKFTCDPDPTIVGAGFFDFSDFDGEGLRCETLGDVLAVYFSSGVAFVRATGVPTSPDEPQIISTERGLLSTHSVVSIGRNVHFGVFTDGWWLIDQSGRWQELGVVKIEEKVIPKWRQSFYEEIPANHRHKVVCYYDQPNNLIYITRPTFTNTDPQEVWIYDPSSDRVFIENYPVTCFGTLTPPAEAGVTIGALPGTIGSLPGTIGSYAPVPGYPKVRCHGDLRGFVYQHRRDIVGYDPAVVTGSPPVEPVPLDPTWSISSGFRSPAGHRVLTTVDRVSLEYFNHANPNTVSITVRGPGQDGFQSRNVVLNQGDHEDVRTRDAWFRYSSQSPGINLSGTGEFHIRRVSVDVWSDDLEPRGL